MASCLRRGGLQHGRHRLGLGLDQLPAGLAIGDLPGHQAGVRQPGIGLGGIVIWQFVAVIGNRCLAARVFLAANTASGLSLGLAWATLSSGPAGGLRRCRAMTWSKPSPLSPNACTGLSACRAVERATGGALACNKGLGATGIERSPRQNVSIFLAEKSKTRANSRQPVEMRSFSPR